MQETRMRIVETATRLFYSQGYNSTGVNQVIREAGVAKASLYQYFPSKEDLLIEYLRLTMINTSKLLAEAHQKHRAPKDKALSLFDFLLKITKQTGFQGCNFLNIAAEIPKDNRRVCSLIKEQKNQIRSIFKTILKPARKESLADEMYLLFDSALVASRVFNDSWPIKTARKAASKLL
jgi:AcrR family transcriptional regulator